ncbi:hypothetical protein [Alteriqipengyuania lutimaris]|uniref:hypothetical protein n=1 Tax=Alteriqipengyuania lutimaris TaxID=1538146 RepID=UPI0011C0307B|nr:hypothetical protein [Alteriqipengyuania lutimaris]MBB3034794.1 hypothetical protein [Alteriqipengyuania lutimaris]
MSDINKFECKLRKHCTGASIKVRKLESQWSFEIGSTIRIDGWMLWRLVGESCIEVCSEDHGHSFGLPDPVDAEEKFSDLAGGSKIKRVELMKPTGDLTFHLSNGMWLELIVTSSGYENWVISEGGEFLAAGMSGGI